MIETRLPYAYIRKMRMRTSVRDIFAYLVLACTVLIAGCDAEAANWNAYVLSNAENPKNGQHDFTPSRAEVIADRCGFWHSSCVSVRILDETGFANAQGGRLFTYRGNPQLVAVSWDDAQTLRVKCQSCDPKKITRQLARVNFTNIRYEL